MTRGTGADDKVVARLLEVLRALPEDERGRRLQRLRDAQPALAGRLAGLLRDTAVPAPSAVAPSGRPVRTSGRQALVLLLAGLAVVALAALVAVNLQRQHQAHQLHQAEAVRAERLERFLAEAFRAASPYMRQDQRDPLGIFGGIAESLLDRERDLDPPTRARLGLSLARLQLARGDHAEAERLLERTMERSGDGYGATPSLAAELLELRATLLHESGDTEAAVAAQEDAIARWQLAPAAPERIAAARVRLAGLLHRLGRGGEAEPAFEAAFPVLLRAIDTPSLEVARALEDCVDFLAARDERDRLRALQAALEQRPQHHDADTLADAEVASLLGRINAQLGASGAAAAHFEDAARRFASLLAETHPRVAQALHDACRAHLASHDLAQARRQCERSLTIRYQALGPGHESVARASLDLATIAWHAGALAEADSHAQRAGRVAGDGASVVDELPVRLLQARIAAARGRFVQALAHLDRAALVEAVRPAGTPAAQEDMVLLRASILTGLGQADAAEQVLAGLQPSAGPSVSAGRQQAAWAAVVRARIAALRHDRTALDDAIPAALARLHTSAEGSGTGEARLLAALAEAARSAGDTARARELFGRALASMSPASHGAYWALAWAGARLCGASANPDRDAQARQLLQENGVDTPLARTFLARR